MFVYGRFPDDTDSDLMWLQHDLYWSLLSWLFIEARHAYRHAESVVGLETELGLAVRDLTGYDHRVLQGAHDEIAAYFRYLKRDLRQQSFAFAGEDVVCHPESECWLCRVKKEWREFYLAESKRLAQIPEICRAVLTAVAYQNTPVGKYAEKTLMRLLMERHDFPFVDDTIFAHL